MDQEGLADVLLKMLSVTEGTHFHALARAFNDLARSVGSPEPQALGTHLWAAVDRAEARGDRVIRCAHVRKVLDVTFDKVIPALERRLSGMGEDPHPFLANPFLYARIANTALRYSADLDRPYVVARAVTRELVDFLGYRPTPVLEGEQVQPRPAERTLVVPVFLREVGVAYFKYEREVQLFLDALRRTPEALRESCGIVLDAISEIAVDPRPYDYLHPVWHRPGHVFGEYDPERVSLSGYYERYVIRGWLLEAAHAYRERNLGREGAGREELTDYQAGVGLGATALLAVSVTGARPGAHSSEQTLAKIANDAALAREDYYRFHVQNAPSTIVADLRREREVQKIPFAGFRLHLNRTMVADRSAQVALERAVAAALTYRRPEFVADLLRFQKSRTARREGMIREAMLLAQIAIEAGHLDQARAEARNAFGRIVEGVERGECGDPWYILGFSANYPLGQTPSDTMADIRLPRLIEAVDDLLALCARLVVESFFDGQDSVLGEAVRFAQEVADWWAQFGAHALDPAVLIRYTPPASCVRYDRAIDALGLIVLQSGPFLDRVRRVQKSLSPEAAFLLADVLIRRGRLDEAEEVLLRWLGVIRPMGGGAPRFLMGEVLHYWLYRAMFENPDQLKQDPVSVWRRLARFADRLIEVAGPWLDLPDFATPEGLLEFYDQVGDWVAPKYDVPTERIFLRVENREVTVEEALEYVRKLGVRLKQTKEEHDEYEEGQEGDEDYDEYEYGEYEEEEYDEDDEEELEEDEDAGLDYEEDEEAGEAAMHDEEDTDEDEDMEDDEEEIIDEEEGMDDQEELDDRAAASDADGLTIEIYFPLVEGPAVRFQRLLSSAYTHMGFLHGLSSILTAATYVPDLGPEHRAEQQAAYVRWAKVAKRVQERTFTGVCAGLALTELELGEGRRALDAKGMGRYIDLARQLFRPLRELSRVWALTLERLLARLDDPERMTIQPTYLWWAGQLAPLRHAILTGKKITNWSEQLQRVENVLRAIPNEIPRVCPRELAVPGHSTLGKYLAQSLEDILVGLVHAGYFNQAHALLELIVARQAFGFAGPIKHEPVERHLALRWARALGYQTGKLIRDYKEDGDRLPEHDASLHRLIQDVIRCVTQFFAANGVDPLPRTADALANDRAWEDARQFVLDFGGDLLTKGFMEPSQLLTVFAKGAKAYLEELSHLSFSERPHVADVFANASPAEREDLARILDMIVRTIIDNYDLYAEYNIATAFSDYGNLTYILLDFIRVRAPIERLREKLQPMLAFYTGMLFTCPQEPGCWCELPDVVERQCRELERQVAAKERQYGTKLGSIQDKLAIGILRAREREYVRWVPLLEQVGAPLARKLDGPALWYQFLKQLVNTTVEDGDPCCTWMEEAAHWLEKYDRTRYLTVCWLRMQAPVQKEFDPTAEQIASYVSSWKSSNDTLDGWYEEDLISP